MYKQIQYLFYICLQKIITLYQYYFLKNDVIKKSRTHIIPYYSQNKHYKIIYKPSIKKKRIIKVLYHNLDITEEILEFLGPHNDFHNIPTTPLLLGYDSLTFEFLNDESKTFNDDEIIKF